MKEIVISTNPNLLDFTFIHQFITNSYWAKDRTIEQVKNAAKNSLNFGVYQNNKQIGYARIVTDFTIFAYLMDVFIIPEEQNKGYATQLLQTILEHNHLQNIETWKLATADAHSFYQKFGFEIIGNPNKIMERKKY